MCRGVVLLPPDHTEAGRAAHVLTLGAVGVSLLISQPSPQSCRHSASPVADDVAVPSLSLPAAAAAEHVVPAAGVLLRVLPATGADRRRPQQRQHQQQRHRQGQHGQRRPEQDAAGAGLLAGRAGRRHHCRR